MRPVPTRARFGVTALPASRLAWLANATNFEMGLFTGPQSGEPLLSETSPDLIAASASYADLVWVALKILREAGAEAAKSPTTPASTQTGPAIAEAVEGVVRRVLDNFSPGSTRVNTLTQIDPSHPEWSVSFYALDGLTAEPGAGAFFSTALGNRAPKARAALRALKARIDELGVLLEFYTPQGTRGRNYGLIQAPFAPETLFADVVKRWRAEAEANRPAPAPVLSSMRPLPAEAAPPAPPMLPPTQNPPWLVPALIATAAAGAALLVFPSIGSGNKGAGAQDVDDEPGWMRAPVHTHARRQSRGPHGLRGR